MLKEDITISATGIIPITDSVTKLSQNIGCVRLGYKW
jgi:hypothetical protein